jgi:hypothetical protein
MYYHSPRGMEKGYGITSGIWDVVFQHKETHLPVSAAFNFQDSGDSRDSVTPISFSNLLFSEIWALACTACLRRSDANAVRHSRDCGVA